MSQLSQFPVYTAKNAPEKSRPTLDQLQQIFGAVPNVAGIMAGSPTLISAFLSVFQNAHAGSLSEADIQVLLLTNAVTNACTWAAAFHTHLALLNGVHVEDVQALRAGLAPADLKASALATLARRFILSRGHVSPTEVAAFTAAGFKAEQALDVILVVAASTITNYAATLGNPPLEDAFAKHAWSTGQ
jgi:AhpD family alkylhydroperoxidase